MLASLKFLLDAPYNRKHRAFAVSRFLQWKAIRFLKLSGRPVTVWGNRKMLLHHDSYQSMMIMYNYIVDWEEFHFISRFVQPHDSVFDVGANMGFYTIWLSRFNTEGSIHSFEPDDTNFDRLSRNIAANKLQDKVILNKLAVSNAIGPLFFTRGRDGENHISLDQQTETSIVNAVRLDDYVSATGIGQIAFMKIDVEGFETQVLEGAEQLLGAKKITVLQLEINKAIKNSGKRVDDLLNLLGRYGYQLCRYDVNENELRQVNYTEEHENYLATFDLNVVNEKLKQTKASIA
ncbi:MAG: methyltransferase FkbM family [Ferruginibacter sp.]|nr:methyltransferase FkbM family [Ferruginibacter sp.]